MGEVYKARDTRLDRIVAVKVAGENFSERFEREARAVYSVGPERYNTIGINGTWGRMAVFSSMFPLGKRPACRSR